MKKSGCRWPDYPAISLAAPRLDGNVETPPIRRVFGGPIPGTRRVSIRLHCILPQPEEDENGFAILTATGLEGRKTARQLHIR